MRTPKSKISTFLETYPFFVSIYFWMQTFALGCILCFTFLGVERVVWQLFPESPSEEHEHTHISFSDDQPEEDIPSHESPDGQIIGKYSQEEVDALRMNYEQIIDEYRHEIAQKNLELAPKKSVQWVYLPHSQKVFLANLDGVKDLEILIESNILKKKEVHFLLELFYEPNTSRGRFQPKTNSLQLFNLKSAPEHEIVSVFVHELGHYIDLTFLEKKRFYDISDVFYNFSWK